MNRYVPAARARCTTAALALELREHTPAGLPDVLASPLLLPISDRSGRDPPGPDDDHEHVDLAGVTAPAVALVALADLLPGLRPAEVNVRGRVAPQSLEEREVIVRPWSDVDTGFLLITHGSPTLRD
jgi:hypothetical protein